MRIAEQEINADNKTSRHLWKFIAFSMIYSRKQIIGSEEQYEFPDPEKNQNSKSSNASFESKHLEFQKNMNSKIKKNSKRWNESLTVQ